MTKWIGIGTALQTAMVLAGHWISPVADLFGPLGVTVSLAVGLLWARAAASGGGRQAASYGRAAAGGAVVGGVCALVGIAVSYLLGDVPAAVLAFGTLSSAVAGALGGLAGRRMRPAAGRTA